MDDNFPTIHLRPPKNHINDPNGMIYYNGRYHVFAQYNPFGAIWGTIHWIHFSTTDFIHWDLYPTLLTPDQEYDKEGCWSGCSFLADKGPAIIYSAFDGQKTLPSIAWSNDSFKDWQKSSSNPIIKNLPFEGLFGFRDHKVFKRNGLWYQLIGSGVRNSGLILCYTSNDLITWNYYGVWFRHEHPSENMLECPDYIELEDQNLLIYSTNDPYKDKTLQSYWALGKETGDTNNSVFQILETGILDPGCFYAPQTFHDDKRIILIGWLREERPNGELIKAGWGGALSLPREIEIKDSKVIMKPIQELKNLRESALRIEKQKSIEKPFELQSQNGLLEVFLNLGNFQSNDKLIIEIEGIESKALQISITCIGLELTDTNESKTLKYTLEKEFKVHFFIDHSILELFLDYKVTLSTRMYDYGQELKIKIYTTANMNGDAYTLSPIRISKIE